MGRSDFSDQFRKIIIRYNHIGYILNVMRPSFCLHADGSGVRLFNDGPDLKLFILVG